MGLKFPEDLAAWKAWEQKQNLLRYAKNKFNKSSQRQEVAAFVLLVSRQAEQAEVLVALEATTPTQIAALLAPAVELEKLGYSHLVLAPAASQEFLEGQGYTALATFTADEENRAELSSIKQVIAAGNYLAVGAWAYQQAQKHHWDFNVVQHGLNTPFVPPLPKNSILFSFSEKDSEFWISGRRDVTAYAVGSQLFYEAAQQPRVSSADIGSQVTFLGQMHGAELPRLSFAKSSYKFCKNHGASYRPHPSERDKISTMTHKLWVKQGISLDTSGTPLNQSNSPVVSIFSTGVLEAAIRGVPAWVYHSNPPAWLKEFWERYGMNQWGSAPTPAPAQPDIEPALAIAKNIAHRLEN